MTALLFRGGESVNAIEPSHRGIAYGDGLFETIRIHAGGVPWWPRHRQRLLRGCERLRIAPPPAGAMEQAIGDLAQGQPDGVLKLIVSRGQARRGYAPQDAQATQWQLSRHAPPAAPSRNGLTVRWCALRLSEQLLLAGIKHCNRLEQVLARAEWDDDAIDDGLLLDTQGNVASATAANVFVLSDGIWRTPRMDRCGVAGVCRAWALEALPAIEARLSPQDIETADAVFLCNAVRGILPVARIGTRRFDAHAAVDSARTLLASAHPAFAIPDLPPPLRSEHP